METNERIVWGHGKTRDGGEMSVVGVFIGTITNSQRADAKDQYVVHPTHVDAGHGWQSWPRCANEDTKGPMVFIVDEVLDLQPVTGLPEGYAWVR